MGRLTTNKDVSEMSMTELAHNSCYAKDHKARYRNYDMDIDARELAKKLLIELADDSFIDDSDETFDEAIIDYLQYGTDCIEGLIAVFYTNLWAMADLRERLKEYEDIGPTPDQLRKSQTVRSGAGKGGIREMNRLAKITDLGAPVIVGSKSGEIYPVECYGCCIDNKIAKQLLKDAVAKLAEYEDLEEQGKLLKLPCAVGDTVYEVQNIRKKIQEYVVIDIHISNCGNLYGWELKDGKGVYSNVNGFSEYAIGKTVFLTQEEAEAALKNYKECDSE